MNKVAILTTHRANNFGAVLQAYSLLSATRELGGDAQILDWRCPYFEKFYRGWFTRGPFIKVLWRNFWRFFIERPVCRKFDAFRLRMDKSLPIRTRAELAAVEADYDTFIVGSDQVWNPLNTASASAPETFDRAYLLDFVKNKPKNAYAASIGVSCIRPESLVSEFAKAWQGFDVISMREHEGAEYVQKVSGHPACAVVDPVLLHDADWWSKNCQSDMKFPENYVFEYNVRQIKGLHALAKGMSREKGARLIRTLVPGQTNLRSNVFRVCAMGPDDFVQAIKNAQCVFSSSFHCAAFSFLFRKRLYLARRTEASSPNTRFAALLRFTGATEQLIGRSDGTDYLMIDFSAYDNALFERKRNSSWEVLREILAVSDSVASNRFSGV